MLETTSQRATAFSAISFLVGLIATFALADGPNETTGYGTRGKSAVELAYPKSALVEGSGQSDAKSASASGKDASSGCDAGCNGGHGRLTLFNWFNGRRHSRASETHPVYEPEVLGASVHYHFQSQVDNGLAAKMVLFHYDFNNELGTDRSRLNRYGRRRLKQLAPLLMLTYRPLIVQESDAEPQLDQARRQHVLEYLAQMSLALTPDRVVIGRSPAVGIDGIEAMELYGNLLLQTQNGPKGAATAQTGGTGLIGVSGSGIEAGN